MNILVVGDSWGMGEWPDTKTRSRLVFSDYEEIEHKGLSQYLEEDGHKVINLSKSGGSNADAVRMLQFYIQRISKEVDLIYVFQSSFCKDIDEADCITDSFNDTMSKYNIQFLFKLHQLAQRYNVKINLIGGSSDTFNYENLEKDFPGVSIVCQSFINLLFYQEHTIKFPIYGILWDQFKHTFERFQDKEFCSLYMSEFLERLKLFEQSSPLKTKYLIPDGSHANRHAHKVLFDYLIKNDPWLNKEKK